MQVNSTSVFTLTPAQQRLWIEWKRSPKSHAYNTTIQLKLVGHLDRERFARAVAESINYFDTFRTYFVEKAGKPHQVVLDSVDTALRFFDFTVREDEAATALDIKAKEFLSQKLQTPCDLMQPPLTEFYLIKTADNIHYFGFFIPHILSDGVSASRLQEFLSLHYNGEDTQVFDEQHVSMSDYCDYDYNSADKEQMLGACSYWQEVLSGHNLRFDFGCKVSTEPNKSGKRKHFTLSESKFAALKQCARANKTTLFTVLAALYNVFLYRYFGQQDIVMSYPLSTRPKELRNFFGFFVNNLPLRTRLASDQTFNHVIQHINERRREDRRYQHVSLADIVKALRNDNIELQQDILNVALVQANFSLTDLALNHIDIESVNFDYGEVNMDLSLLYDPAASDLALAWEYKTHIFDASQIEQMTHHFEHLIDAVLSCPDYPIADLPLLDESEYQKIMYQWNDTASDYDRSATPITLFHKQVMTNPTSIAAIYQDKEICYAELNDLSNMVAHAVVEQKVARGDVVAVCLPPSLERLATILAIMKVGAIYLPLDPSHPQERRDYILADSNAVLLISTDALSDACNETVNTWMIEEVLQSNNVLLSNDFHTHSGDIAYIIYTSGSTGQPKGVKITHQNMCARLAWLQDQFALTHTDLLLHSTNYCFDPSIYEMFWPLCYGGTLIIAENQATKDPRDIIQLIDKHAITITPLVPSVLSNFLDYLTPDNARSIRLMLTGGEILSQALKDTFYKHFSYPDTTLYNLYGPTEATIISTAYACKPNDTAICIGKPIANTYLYILNDRLQPQPSGVVGELYIGGEGVAEGYLNRPDLEAEKFITSPFCDDDVLYKTGDLGYYRDDGNIVFNGRIDDQVKIRGFRIELGEIENTLIQSGIAKDAKVIVNQRDNNTPQLVAYYTSGEKYDADIADTLNAWLPEHMVPKHFVLLEAMPMTSNGKIDKAALPEPAVQTNIGKTHIAARNETEKKLILIWAELLHKDASNISVDDRFFDIGGDSLQIVELSVIIEKYFAVAIPVSTLFGLPTIEACAHYLLDNNSEQVKQDVLMDRAAKQRKALARRRRVA